MAKVANNIFVRGLSGTLGGQFVLKQGRNGTIVSKYPVFDKNRKFTEAQVDRQGKFRDAVDYAKGAKGWSVYVEKAKASNRTPYHVAISDFCHAPEITKLDMNAWNGEAGQVIRVQVVDDVMVMQVNVVITDEAGSVLEQGAAIQAEGEWWVYTTTATAEGGARVVVTARDLPGNIVEMSWE